MKITHLVDKGLTEGETARLSTLLRGLSSEFELGLVAPEDSALVRELSGTRVKICPLKRHKEQRLLSTDVYKILMLLGKERPSVLHLHSSYAVGRAARALGVRALVSEGEGSEGLKRGRVGDKFASFAISRTEGHSSELMKGGVSPSRIKSLGCGVPELVPNGHSCELTVISKCLCIDEYRLVISALGRLSPKLDVRAELFVGEGELLAARRLAALICPLGRIRVSKREDFSRFAPTLPSVFVYPACRSYQCALCLPECPFCCPIRHRTASSSTSVRGRIFSRWVTRFRLRGALARLFPIPRFTKALPLRQGAPGKRDILPKI